MDPLYLVLDTNVFLNDACRGVLINLDRRHCEPFPDCLRIFIPMVVLQELKKKASMNPFTPNEHHVRALAIKSLEFLNSLQHGKLIFFQNCCAHREANIYRQNKSDNDELVLFAGNQVREYHSTNLRLVTNDKDLTRRANEGRRRVQVWTSSQMRNKIVRREAPPDPLTWFDLIRHPGIIRATLGDELFNDFKWCFALPIVVCLVLGALYFVKTRFNP